MIEVELSADGAVDFESWVRPHLRVLAAVAERQVGAGHRDDLVQDTILRAWQRRSTYDSERGEVRSWLLGILLAQARRHRSRIRVHVPWTGQEPTPARSETPTPELDAAIAGLPRRQREVIVLHYLADLPVREVARVLNIDASTVTSHLDKARRRLADLLGADHDD